MQKMSACTSGSDAITRRSLIAGAGVALAGAAVLSAQAKAHAEEAAEGEAAEATSGNAMSAWGTEYPWPAVPPTITDDQIEEELNVDVAIIGLGVSGVAAFRSAAEAGANVVAFEKAEKPSVRSMQFCYINGSHYEELGMEPVDEDLIINEEWNESAQVANYVWSRSSIPPWPRTATW